MRRLLTGTSLAVVLLAFSGCEKVDYIELTPSDVVFKQPNNQVWMEAACMARNGVRAVKARVNWSVADPEIAEVNEKGLLKPKASGDTEVIARYGDVEARVPVHVIFVHRIEVEPMEVVTREGADAVALKVRAFGKDGREITDRTPALSSQDKTVAQIVGKGGILPLDPGTTTIDVQVDGVKTSVKFTVEADPLPRKK
ncbi:MAG: Ig-like domain-containing protein [Myxococcota bacterium]